MRSASVGAALVAAVAIASACNSNDGGTPTPTPSGTPTLRDEYEPLDPVPASGGITQITFHDDGTYFLERTTSPNADEILQPESGTFVVDLNASTLTLTPTGGAPQTLPFQVQLTGTTGAASVSGDLKPLGLGSTILDFIVSFLLDGHLFHTDTPATASNGTDDAGWAAQDGAVASTEGGCSPPVEAGPPTSSGGGIDVSHYQGNVDWATVKTSQRFAYAKATEGTGYKDVLFSTNFAGMQAAGIQRGAYHFFRASKDPVAQADFFVSVLQANGYDPATDLAPMLDVEVLDGVDAATATSGVRAFLNEAQSKLGVTFYVYTGPSFWAHQMGDPQVPNPLWIAHYTKASQPSIPPAWSTYTIWQFTQADSVAGVGGNVDGDRWGSASATAADGGASSGGGSCGSLDGGDAGDAGLIPGTCTHDVCTAGTALGQACDSCTMIVCQYDPYCCDTYWGLSCFPDVQQYCGQTCP